MSLFPLLLNFICSTFYDSRVVRLHFSYDKLKIEDWLNLSPKISMDAWVCSEPCMV